MLDVLEVKKQLAMHPRKLHCVCALVVLGVLHAAAASVLSAHGQHAMVASQSELASQAGVDVMKQGGNAVDAAVAVGFALAVVHPLAGNIGGGGFMLFRAANGDTHFLDYREKAPAKATATMYLEQNGKYIPNSSTVGYKAIAVPGSVAGLVYAQKHWGKLTLQQVMSPAIKLARDGWALSYEYTQFFRGGWGVHLSEFPESRRIFQRDGNFYQPGEILRQPELARTLERIAQNPDDFYHGQIARELAAAIQKGGGLITAEDLAAYEAKERQPVQGTYRGLEIISAPPPSSGGVALIEALNILEGYDLAKAGNRSAESIHLVTEAFRRAFFDRAQLMGDPDFTKVPVAQLIDKKYGVAWRESIQPHEATLSAALHRPSQFSALDRMAEAMGAPATVPEPDHTTHYSVVDPDGNAVAVTTTPNGVFGSGVTVEHLGFLLNDEMDDFAAGPDIPNRLQLVHGPANYVGPGKRPLSAMTPTIVLKDGKLFLILGSEGGPRIISTVANILLGVVDWGLNIQQAVNAPRFHNQWLPDTLYLEPDGFSPDTVKLLETYGYKTFGNREWSDGECIMVDSKTGERLGASDGRYLRSGMAIGY